MAHTERILRWLGLAAVAVYVIGAFTSVPYRVAERLGVRPHLAKAGAIVVLADSVTARGALSDESAARTEHAIHLFEEGWAPLIAFSGKGPGPRNEATIRTYYARGNGIAHSRILTFSGDDTRQEALHANRILRARGIRTILLVSNPLHLLRADPLFRNLGFTVYPAPAPNAGPIASSSTNLAQLRRDVEELVAWLM